jgi:hypothetical protein
MNNWYTAGARAPGYFNLEIETQPNETWRLVGTFESLDAAKKKYESIGNGRRGRIVPAPTQVWRTWT